MRGTFRPNKYLITQIFSQTPFLSNREIHIAYESFYFTFQIIYFDIMSVRMGRRGQILPQGERQPYLEWKVKLFSVFTNESWNIQSPWKMQRTGFNYFSSKILQWTQVTQSVRLGYVEYFAFRWPTFDLGKSETNLSKKWVYWWFQFQNRWLLVAIESVRFD